MQDSDACWLKDALVKAGYLESQIIRSNWQARQKDDRAKHLEAEMVEKACVTR